MTKPELAKAILHAFIDGLSTAKDKKEQLKKLIDDFETALQEMMQQQEEDEEAEKENEDTKLEI